MNYKNIFFILIIFCLSLTVHANHTEIFGVIFNQVGTGDNSFNSNVYSGFNDFLQQNPEFSNVVYIDTENNISPFVEKMVANNIKSIFLVGSQYSAEAEYYSNSTKYKNINFHVIDGSDKKNRNYNVLAFDEFFMSFKAGVCAAVDFDSIAFIGLANIPAVGRFMRGFEAGIRSVRPNFQNYDIVNLDFNKHSREEAFNIAKKMYSNYDIIFTVAGFYNQAVERAAVMAGKKVITTDKPLHYFNNNRAIYGSVVKYIDKAVTKYAKRNLRGLKSRDMVEGYKSPYLFWEESSNVSLQAQLSSRIEFLNFFRLLK
ncbi:MAG: BMP family ABC transporter substrate-binding protein [Candidatus Muiribacteriota bacterium]